MAVKEQPTYHFGMCYIVEIMNHLDEEIISMTVQRSAGHEAKLVKIWLTSQHDSLGIVYRTLGNFSPFKTDVPFGGDQVPKITIQQGKTINLKCNKSDLDYVSEQQCFADEYLFGNFSCHEKCLPIQMSGFRYVRDFSAIEKCKNLDDEVCNNGPVVWDELGPTFKKCPKPCLETNYAQSQIEMMNNKYDYSLKKENEAFFYLKVELNQFVLNELLVYDANDMIGSIGGSLGLFFGFAFFDIISRLLDKFIDYVSTIASNKELVSPASNLFPM